MTKLKDKKGNVVGITMHEWKETGYSTDWSNDFFNIGGCPTDEEDDTIYLVDDVEYCIDQANDCINHKGDFYDGEKKNPNEEINIEWIVDRR